MERHNNQATQELSTTDESKCVTVEKDLPGQSHQRTKLTSRLFLSGVLLAFNILLAYLIGVTFHKLTKELVVRVSYIKT